MQIYTLTQNIRICRHKMYTLTQNVHDIINKKMYKCAHSYKMYKVGGVLTQKIPKNPSRYTKIGKLGLGFFGIFWDFLGFLNFQIGIGFFWVFLGLGFFGFFWDFLGFFGIFWVF